MVYELTVIALFEGESVSRLALTSLPQEIWPGLGRWHEKLAKVGGVDHRPADQRAGVRGFREISL